MKVVMRQHYQDARVHYYPEQVVEVDSTMGAYLLQHRMALPVEEPPAVVEPEPQAQPEAEPAESPTFEKPQQRSRRAR